MQFVLSRVKDCLGKDCGAREGTADELMLLLKGCLCRFGEYGRRWEVALGSKEG